MGRLREDDVLAVVRIAYVMVDPSSNSLVLGESLRFVFEGKYSVIVVLVLLRRVPRK